jgi:hypothetical protein
MHGWQGSAWKSRPEVAEIEGREFANSDFWSAPWNSSREILTTEKKRFSAQPTGSRRSSRVQAALRLGLSPTSSNGVKSESASSRGETRSGEAFRQKAASDEEARAGRQTSIGLFSISKPRCPFPTDVCVFVSLKGRIKLPRDKITRGEHVSHAEDHFRRGHCPIGRRYDPTETLAPKMGA